MQHSMQIHPLSKDQIDALLHASSAGSLATLNANGWPYVTPVHFLYDNNALYIHGLPKGQKIDNINADPRVSMTIYEMGPLLLDPDGRPCHTNTKFESVILSGKATILKDFECKKAALSAIVRKFTPHLSQKELPDHMIKGTAVIKIEIQEITGKYYSQ